MAKEKIVQSMELDRRNEVDMFAEGSVKTSEQRVSCSLFLVNIYTYQVIYISVLLND